MVATTSWRTVDDSPLDEDLDRIRPDYGVVLGYLLRLRAILEPDLCRICAFGGPTRTDAVTDATSSS